MTHFHARAHEVRAMLTGDEFVIVRPVSAATCDVLGGRVSAKSPAWTGLMFDHPALFVRAAKMHVPFLHPEDAARGLEWDEAFYAVRPIMAPGDAVVVKETWAKEFDVINGRYVVPQIRYRASHVWAFGWKPAQNMRPEHSRLTLSVSDVDVKRLQAVTEDEARLVVERDTETDSWWGPDREGAAPGTTSRYVSAYGAYRHVWDANHPRTPWDSNPWIVTARCQVHQRNIAKVTSEEAA